MNSHQNTSDLFLFSLRHLTAGVLNPSSIDLSAVLVMAVSLVIGFLTVLVFRYAGDQKTIGRAKDQLKAHLLALRLFQNHLPVLLTCYGRVCCGIGRYLGAVFKPVLFSSISLTFVLVQLAWYVGSIPLKPGAAFLITVRTANSHSPYETSLQLPTGMAITAPAVHIPIENEIVWRVVAENEGEYDVVVGTAGSGFSKHVVVSPGMVRLSPVRLRGHFWERMFLSSEPALPSDSPIQSIAVDYPSRTIHFAWIEWNWLLLLVLLCMGSMFAFKTIFRIQI